ncbi:MAG: hypothetical protein JWP04_1514 [Belnapia sp.]|jgi:hypothetical protein|nr:hypothetical protein [Belnapia sp.]
MRHPYAILAFGLLGSLPLAGCVNETAIPEATSHQQSRGPSHVADPPPARVVAFDGLWVGTITLNPDRTRECPRVSSQDRRITVTQGRATFVLNPETRQTQTGPVAAEGSVRLVDALDRTIATTGLFSDGTFLGEYRNGLCTYAVRMTKRS